MLKAGGMVENEVSLR